MKDEFNRCEDKNPNSDTEKDYFDKICLEDDFGSLYVSDEMFSKLVKRFIERTDDNQ